MIGSDRKLRIAMAVLLSCSAAGCGAGSRNGNDEGPESVIVTVWTDQFELFMEHPPLRSGEAAQFAAHLTHLDTFEPVADGPVRFRFSKEGRVVGEKVLAAPGRPGLFVPEFTFEETGDYSLIILVESAKGQGGIRVEPLKVVATDSPAPQAESIPVAGDRVGYLKEQQWKLPFRTELAQSRTLRGSFSVGGRIMADPARDFDVLPPLAGQFIAPPQGLPVIGQRVRRGQLLGFLQPPLSASAHAALEDNQMQAESNLAQLREKLSNARAMVAESNSRLELARSEKARVDQLFAVEAVPRKRVELAARDLEIAEANLEAARRNLHVFEETVGRVDALRSAPSDLRLPLRAPGSGTVVEFQGSPGSFVKPDASLYRLVDLSRVWIKANVPEAHIHEVSTAQEARLEIPRRTDIELGPGNSRLVAIGDVVDPETRTIPIIWSIDNPRHEFKIGALVELRVFSSPRTTGLAVPVSAVLQEDNKKIAYVQVSGETFDRRIVETGVEDAGMVEILKGLQTGDRVVTEGAYEISLAARSTSVPTGEGHVH